VHVVRQVDDGRERRVREVSVVTVTITTAVEVPLWSEVPEPDRVTVEMAERRYPSPHWAPFVVERIAERLTANGCEIAVRATEFGAGKWWPCGMPSYGHDRCKRHGGPGRPARVSAARATSDWAGLMVRLIEKANTLAQMALDTADYGDKVRLEGKAEGVHLALSFIEETWRGE
jgi:hypothetical protein